MKKTCLLILSILFSAILSLYPADLGRRGISVISRDVIDGQYVFNVVDEGGRRFQILSSGDLTEKEADRLVTAKNIFFKWQYVTIDTLKFSFTTGRIEVLIIPRTFNYKNVNILRYMPAGMQFYFIESTENFEYDFRIFVSDLFLRIKAQYFDEEQLCERLLSAIQNPIAYTQNTDPLYMLKRFAEVDKQIEEMKYNNKKAFQEQQDNIDNVNTTLNSAIDKWRTQYQTDLKELENYLQKAYDEFTSALDNRLTTMEKNSAAAVENLKNETNKQLEEIKESIDELNKNLTTFNQEFSSVRYALMVLNNTGLFGSISEINKDGVKRILELKKENPQITIKDAHARLKGEGIKMSGKEVKLVFSVYFNEFK
ncbi:MAG: hypothetical protein AB1798_08620 [Spirochaetota bacterium]